MQTSGSSRWRFCNILFLPTASFRFPNKLASWELWVLRYSGTATKPGNTDGGEEDRRSHFSSRIIKWIGKIRLCIPSVHQQSSQDTENAPRKPNSAADSGHKLQVKDHKLLTAAWSVQMNRDRHLALQRRLQICLQRNKIWEWWKVHVLSCINALCVLPEGPVHQHTTLQTVYDYHASQQGYYFLIWPLEDSV